MLADSGYSKWQIVVGGGCKFGAYSGAITLKNISCWADKTPEANRDRQWQAHGLRGGFCCQVLLDKIKGESPGRLPLPPPPLHTMRSSTNSVSLWITALWKTVTIIPEWAVLCLTVLPHSSLYECWMNVCCANKIFMAFSFSCKLKVSLWSKQRSEENRNPQTCTLTLYVSKKYAEEALRRSFLMGS